MDSDDEDLFTQYNNYMMKTTGHSRTASGDLRAFKTQNSKLEELFKTLNTSRQSPIKTNVGSRGSRQSGGSKTSRQSGGSKTSRQSGGSKTSRQSGGSKTSRQSGGSKTIVPVGSKGTRRSGERTSRNSRKVGSQSPKRERRERSRRSRKSRSPEGHVPIRTMAERGSVSGRSRGSKTSRQSGGSRQSKQNVEFRQSSRKTDSPMGSISSKTSKQSSPSKVEKLEREIEELRKKVVETRKLVAGKWVKDVTYPHGYKQKIAQLEKLKPTSTTLSIIKKGKQNGTLVPVGGKTRSGITKKEKRKKLPSITNEELKKQGDLIISGLENENLLDLKLFQDLRFDELKRILNNLSLNQNIKLAVAMKNQDVTEETIKIDKIIILMAKKKITSRIIKSRNPINVMKNLEDSHKEKISEIFDIPIESVVMLLSNAITFFNKNVNIDEMEKYMLGHVGDLMSENVKTTFKDKSLNLDVNDLYDLLNENLDMKEDILKFIDCIKIKELHNYDPNDELISKEYRVRCVKGKAPQTLPPSRSTYYGSDFTFHPSDED